LHEKKFELKVKVITISKTKTQFKREEILINYETKQRQETA